MGIHGEADEPESFHGEEEKFEGELSDQSASNKGPPVSLSL